jgi:predicted lipoprotein with Yx(FWY)xxD motif
MSVQRTVPTRKTPGQRPGSRFAAGRRRKIIIGVVAVLAVLACLAGLALRLYLRYADIVRSTAEHGRVVVEAAPAGALGTVLVTNKGFALYMFVPDAARRVTCTGGCATAWPPLLVRDGQTVVAGPGVRPGLLGTAPNPGGGRVVTYRGWPLYAYLGDAVPDRAAGQGVDDDGGYWYVMRPSGQIIRG